jgi:hypothetical protein
MDRASPARWQRSAALALVLALHAAGIFMLLRVSRSGVLTDSNEQPVQLTMLPTATVPRVRSPQLAKPRSGAPRVVAVAPPLLNSGDSSAVAPAAASAGGRGAGVDWAAEARRALQAFEIRNQPPSSYSSVSRDPGEDAWWPRGRHRAGDRFKTPSGDWIVWVDSNCYQVASADSIGSAQGAALSRTICQEPPHGGPAEPVSEAR